MLKVAEATLAGPRITVSLAMPGTDWIRVDSNGIRRQDQRTQFLTANRSLILIRYDAALIGGDEEFSLALASGRDGPVTPSRYGRRAWFCHSESWRRGRVPSRPVTYSRFPLVT